MNPCYHWKVVQHKYDNQILAWLSSLTPVPQQEKKSWVEENRIVQLQGTYSDHLVNCLEYGYEFILCKFICLVYFLICIFIFYSILLCCIHSSITHSVGRKRIFPFMFYKHPAWWFPSISLHSCVTRKRKNIIPSCTFFMPFWITSSSVSAAREHSQCCTQPSCEMRYRLSCSRAQRSSVRSSA